MSSYQGTFDYSPYTRRISTAVFGAEAGPQHEKAMKQAFYNTAALVFVILSGAISVAVYYVLEAFLRPLLWAALCGTFLHPFKSAGTRIVRSWLTSLRDSHTPFAIGIALIPVQIVDKSTDGLGKLLRVHYKLLTSTVVLLPISYYLLVFHPFWEIFTAFERVFSIIRKVLEVFQNPLWVWSLVIGYIVILIFWWRPSSSAILTYFSIPVWTVLLFHLASLAGSWKVPLSLAILTLIIVGCVEDNKKKDTTSETQTDRAASEKTEPALQNLLLKSFSIVGVTAFSKQSPETLPEAENIETDQVKTKNSNGIDAVGTDPDRKPKTNEKDEVDAPQSKPGRKIAKVNAQPKTERVGTSDPYFIALFWIFVLSRIWFHFWILQIVPFLVSFYVIKTVILWTGAWSFVQSKLSIVNQQWRHWTHERKDAIVPAPLRGLWALVLEGDKKIITWTESSMDKLMSVFIILCLIIFTVMATGFLAIQVHQESAHMVRLASNAINETVTSNPDLFKWLPENMDVQKVLDSMVHRAYVFGRGWTASKVNSLLSGHNTNSSNVEKQVTEFVDRLYDMWLNRNEQSYTNKSSRVALRGLKRRSSFSWNLSHWMTNDESMVIHVTTIYDLLKENMDTLRSLGESIWTLLKGNINLVVSITTFVLSLVLSSGTYVLNFGLSSVIFITTLFYLLSSSGRDYKLVEWFSGVSMGTKLGESVNNAIRDVFGASLKMATFYGVYTWTTHSIFGINLVFIPSALAASLAVVPFMGSYWAAVPGALELWVIHDEALLALFLLVLHFLPTYVVDVSIYREISGGGHPYLTGLAVAGGIYWFGLEGAIVGPIVLCCLIAAFHVYNGVFTEPETTAPEFRRVSAVGQSARYRDLTGTPISRTELRRAISEER